MLLTIIIPAWNAEKTLDECLASVFGQTVSDFEVRVINDGSTDGTEAILAEWQARYPDRLFFETVENGGQGRARNIALEKAQGKYIGFVDSDDWIEPDMYEKLLAVSRKEDADLALCEVTAHFPDGTTDRERIYRPDRPMAAAGFANNKLFRRELVDGVRFAEEKLWYEDLEFTAIAIHRTGKIAHLNKSLYHYRRGLPSTMNNQNAEKNLDLLTVMQHLEDELLPDAKDDFEFLVLNHVLLDAMNRVQAMTAEGKRNVLWMLRTWVQEKIPRLSACPSFQQESRNRQIIMRLHYTGLSDLAALILKAKG